MKIQYSANNSGGHWWLTDDDWRNLEKAGWAVDWCWDNEFQRGHLTGGRYMGALATYASRVALSLDVAKAEFGAIVHQDPDDEGCNCCGNPHQFYEDRT